MNGLAQYIYTGYGAFNSKVTTFGEIARILREGGLKELVSEIPIYLDKKSSKQQVEAVRTLLNARHRDENERMLDVMEGLRDK